eukprot:scaffold7139_cov115-Cylindrotheca_fusiformis.AAC.18
MAKSSDDSPEWTTVTKNSKRRARTKCRHAKSLGTHSATSSLTLKDIEISLEACLGELRNSVFFQIIKDSLKRIPDIERTSEIVCYGVGNFGKSKNSAPLWQLSLVIAIKEFLLTEHETPVEVESHTKKPNMSMLFFDPCMTQQEATMLERFSIQTIPINEKGKRKATNQTLFFMPHCPMILYANVLHTNWENVSNVIIFGNLLSTYTNRLGEGKAGDKLLRLLEPYWNEILLPICKQDIDDMSAFFEHAFNDSSITHFRNDQVFGKWPDKPEGGYDDGDEGELV